MRDPYEIVGVARGASFEEIRAAYRRTCKSRHPDMGGSHEQMVELNTAYEFILSELKRGAHARAERSREDARQQAPGGADASAPFEDAQAHADDRWRANAAHIDEELESLRRASESLDERLRAMRQQAWREGEKIVWTKLTWDDLARFFINLARSGVKELATLFAALIGVGSIFVEANFVSALVILGSGIGLFLSLALKSDKGGFMSAGLLLFGLTTIWLPPVRAALFTWPLATISVLICLGLIFKFTQEGGIAGLMTGGVLALFMISLIVDDTQRRAQHASPDAPRPQPVAPTITGSGPSSQSLPAPAVRELLAAQGAVLKFVAGVPYQLKVRAGYTTTLAAASGEIAFYEAKTLNTNCVRKLEFRPPPAAAAYVNIDQLLGACRSDAVFSVTATQ